MDALAERAADIMKVVTARRKAEKSASAHDVGAREQCRPHDDYAPDPDEKSCEEAGELACVASKIIMKTCG